MTKVDFQVLCLQAGGGRKISEVQLRVYYYWFATKSIKVSRFIDPCKLLQQVTPRVWRDSRVK